MGALRQLLETQGVKGCCLQSNRPTRRQLLCIAVDTMAKRTFKAAREA